MKNTPDKTVIDWLMEGDPAIRWQALRDLTDVSAEEINAERARVATEGWGAKLLDMQAEDGNWGGSAWNPGWDSTMHALWMLRDFGLDPACEPALQAIQRVNDHVTWQGCGPEECDQNRFFEGEIEPCINGQVMACGAYFRQEMSALAERLLSEQLADGGWNCDAEFGSTRGSFNTTICVLEALLEYENFVGGDAQVQAARLRGEEYLLERELFKRLSTGEIIRQDRKFDADWTQFAFPTWWHYDVLRGLDYLRSAGAAPDARIADAIDLLRSKRGADGRWLLDVRYPRVMFFEISDGEGLPDRWITLRALRVLKWAEGTTKGE
ncbi:MAG: hypothetical protein V2J07_09670 [Anaerolineae bacterium]|jgi:hypothetical protein|nr:hypothetical protein [Anaerolineae bacterium]